MANCFGKIDAESRSNSAASKDARTSDVGRARTALVAKMAPVFPIRIHACALGHSID
jgi:hypothetical protein